MKKIYLSILVVISILIFLFLIFDGPFNKKNPKLNFIVKTDKEIYYPLDPIYFNAVIKNVSGEHQNIKKEDYALRLYLLNEKNEELKDQLFPVYGLMYEDEISLAPGDSLNFLKVIRFHNYLDPFYTGKYKLIIKYNQSDSLIKNISFREPENPIEKEIYEEYKKIYTKYFYEGKYAEMKDPFKKLYYKIKSEYSESDYLSYLAFHYLMNVYADRDYETFKSEFFYVLDKKHNSYSIESFINAYFNYFTFVRGRNRNSISEFYYTLVNRYEDNAVLKEVMKLNYKQIFDINQINIE